VVQRFDAPGSPPGTFQLTSQAGVALDLHRAVSSAESVDVRGTSGLVGEAPDYVNTDFHYSRSLVWADGGTLFRLDFTDVATDEQAVAFADGLSVLTTDERQALLFPTSLRTDLVPMRQLP